ncbi:unnamed protein product [Ectocarpus sp. 8 AP-2014]
MARPKTYLGYRKGERNSHHKRDSFEQPTQPPTCGKNAALLLPPPGPTLRTLWIATHTLVLNFHLCALTGKTFGVSPSECCFSASISPGVADVCTDGQGRRLQENLRKITKSTRVAWMPLNNKVEATPVTKFNTGTRWRSRTGCNGCKASREGRQTRRLTDSL